jgi:anaerobic magnesium-protoporphyrin IX monomethyl ester cyclase
MKVLFIEPPREFWFVMGEYMPPPFGIIQLAAYLEREVEDVDIELVDCTAEGLGWDDIDRAIERYDPDIVAAGAFATCNAYLVIRTLEAAKRIDGDIITVTGGQHFSATAQESLQTYPEIDLIVRGEGEETLVDLVRKPGELERVEGISYRRDGRVVHNPPRPLIQDLNDLPFPGYHLVRDLVKKYHFAAMAGKNAPYALVEGSRGCSHRCTFCTQWKHWGGAKRLKTPGRIVDEIEYCYHEFGSRFIWLTDDDFGPGNRAERLAGELLDRELGDDLMLFLQWRCDDVIRNEAVLPKLRRAGLYWVMMGVESPSEDTLRSYRKGIEPTQASRAVEMVKDNDIFSHAMFVIGHRNDSSETIAGLREFADDLDPDFAIFTALTPFPGTQIYQEARENGWIEDDNWSHYDMAHAIMPTEVLSVAEVQRELYECYRSFYGSWSRKMRGVLSLNPLKRRLYWHMAGQGVVRQFRALV